MDERRAPVCGWRKRCFQTQSDAWARCHCQRAFVAADCTRKTLVTGIDLTAGLAWRRSDTGDVIVQGSDEKGQGLQLWLNDNP